MIQYQIVPVALISLTQNLVSFALKSRRFVVVVSRKENLLCLVYNQKYEKLVSKRKNAPKPTSIEGIYILGGFGSGNDPVFADVSFFVTQTFLFLKRPQVMKILPGKDTSWHSLSPLLPCMYTQLDDRRSLRNAKNGLHSRLLKLTYKILTADGYNYKGELITGNDSHAAVLYDNKVFS